MTRRERRPSRSNPPSRARSRSCCFQMPVIAAAVDALRRSRTRARGNRLICPATRTSVRGRRDSPPRRGTDELRRDAFAGAIDRHVVPEQAAQGLQLRGGRGCAACRPAVRRGRAVRGGRPPRRSTRSVASTAQRLARVEQRPVDAPWSAARRPIWRDRAGRGSLALCTVTPHRRRAASPACTVTWTVPHLRRKPVLGGCGQVTQRRIRAACEQRRPPATALMQRPWADRHDTPVDPLHASGPDPMANAVPASTPRAISWSSPAVRCCRAPSSAIEQLPLRMTCRPRDGPLAHAP